MPPVRTNADIGPRRTKPFKPPTRVSSGDSSTLSAKAGTTKASAGSRTKFPVKPSGSRKAAAPSTMISSDEEEEAEEDDEVQESGPSSTRHSDKRRTTLQSKASDPSTPRRHSTTALAVADTDPLGLIQDDPDEHTVPRALLARLLYEGFEDKNTKVGKEAMGVLELYVKVFVKEAIARSRQESSDKAEANGDLDSSWVQVEDLETIAPQLMLDF